jgi:hypothetical protein
MANESGSLLSFAIAISRGLLNRSMLILKRRPDIKICTFIGEPLFTRVQSTFQNPLDPSTCHPDVRSSPRQQAIKWPPGGGFSRLNVRGALYGNIPGQCWRGGRIGGRVMPYLSSARIQFRALRRSRLPEGHWGKASTPDLQKP